MNDLSLEQLEKNHRQVPADYYDRGISHNLLQRYWHVRRFKILPQVFSKVKGRVLDLGCHAGLLSNKIASTAKVSVVGIDLSESAIQYARKRYPYLEFQVADIQKGIPFSDNSFEAVSGFDVLEHLPNLEFVVKEIKRVLKPKGYLILGIPRENFLFRLIWFFWTKSRGKIWKDLHIHRFSEELLQKIFDSQGFKRIMDKKILLQMYWVIKYQKVE